MKELITSMKIVQLYNQMSFEEFVTCMERGGYVITEEEKEEWKWTGLNNTDFLKTKL